MKPTATAHSTTPAYPAALMAAGRDFLRLDMPRTVKARNRAETVMKYITSSLQISPLMNSSQRPLMESHHVISLTQEISCHSSLT